MILFSDYSAFIIMIFFFVLKLPSDFSSPLFHEVSDGDGWSLVLYYKITEVITSTKIVLSRSCYYIQLVSVFRMHRELFCMKFL